MHRNGYWKSICLCGLVSLVGMLVNVVDGEEPAKQPAANPSKVKAADGKLTVSVPADWVRKQPSVNMIEHEYAAPSVKQGEADGRLTMMMAGGSIDANIQRWVDQFAAPAGKPKPVPKRETLKVGDLAAQWVDIEGSYQDRRGPLAPAVTRDNYRMLGAIVEIKEGGLFFLKFYGPKTTMDHHAEAFRKMVEAIQPSP